MNTLRWASLFVVMQSLLLWSAGGSAVVALLSVAVSFAAIVWQPQLPFQRRVWWTLLPTVFTVLLVARIWRPYSADEHVGVLPAAGLLCLAEFGLLVQALVLLRAPGDIPSSRLVASLSALTFLSFFNRTIDPSMMPLYLLLAIALTVGCALLSQASDSPPGGAPARRRQAIVATVLLCSSMGAWRMAYGWEVAVSRVQVILPAWMARAVTHRQSSRLYVRAGALISVTMEKQTDPLRPALRVYTEKAPGYLRGRVFDTYRRSEWHLASQRRGKWRRMRDKQYVRPLDQTPPGLAAASGGEALFAIGAPASPPFISMAVQNDPGRGEVYFTPLSANYVQGVGSFVALDEHGVIHGGLKTNEPYTLFAASRPQPQSLPDHLRRRLLSTPREVESWVEELADDVCREAVSARQKMAAVTAFFQDNFEYTLDRVEFPAGVEPLSYFLKNRSPAHCEFFASGAVTLLRFQGVPCRYVTGYVVTELEDEYGDYWLARNRNAHAWVEAYDDSRSQWVLVEPTPGMRLPSDDGRTADLGRANSGTAGSGNPRGIGGRRWLGFGWLLRWRTANWIATPTLLCLAALLLTIPALWSYTKRRRNGEDPRLSAMRRAMRRLDRKLQRRSFLRQPHETLHHFSRRLRLAAGDDVWLQTCAEWYEEYARALYSGADELRG